MLGICKGFWHAGYSVLLFDYRSHTYTRQLSNNTKSATTVQYTHRRSIGHLEQRDASAALAWLKNYTKDSKGTKIGLVGASMGGAIALCLAAEEPDAINEQSKADETENHEQEEVEVEGGSSVIACATDCAFANLKDVLEVSLDAISPTRNLPIKSTDLIPLHKLAVSAICAFTELFFGYSKT